ncbi:MAG: chemotaxis protein MotB [Rhodobacteraceae bacterium]|nr:chemotaxis protein MotB [Paracoccaceae bacterium]
MAAPPANAPIIIKRKKVVAAEGHHGGAWKVAYADFVTAMMAFFMLMWLLNATTEKQRKGIADYFNPTIPVNRISGGGEGVFGGDSVFSEEALPQNGTGGSDQSPSTERQARGSTGVDTTDIRSGEAEERRLKEIEELLNANSGESSVADELLQHIHTRVTDEGLIVELFDLPGEPLFRGDSDEATVILQQLTRMIAGIFEATTNRIAVNGHTQSFPVVLAANPGWDRSTNRAHATRKLLEGGGLDASRMQRIAGWSDRNLATSNPMAARNNRIEVILLRTDRAATGK